jgi:PqqD family protein of HPr-rel-A system
MREFTWSIRSPECYVEFSSQGEDMSVLFNKASGDTHLVASFSVNVLEALSREALTVSQLTDALRHLFDPVEYDGAKDYVAATLLELQNVGLVRTLP